MANEITITSSLTFYKPSIMSSAISRAFNGLQRSVTGTTYVQDSMLAAITATLIPLGNVTNPHWAYFYNLDPVNYLQIQNGVSGTPFLRLLAGDPAVGVPLDPSVVPYVIANTAPVQMEYLIISL
jgi:hypothetical protein